MEFTLMPARVSDLRHPQPHSHLHPHHAPHPPHPHLFLHQTSGQDVSKKTRSSDKHDSASSITTSTYTSTSTSTSTFNSSLSSCSCGTSTSKGKSSSCTDEFLHMEPSVASMLGTSINMLDVDVDADGNGDGDDGYNQTSFLDAPSASASVSTITATRSSNSNTYSQTYHSNANTYSNTYSNAMRSRTESVYIRPDELPPSKDEESIKFRNEAMVSVTDVLSSEAKTSQGLLDSPKMILLRALFDVPKGTDDYKSIARWVMILFLTSNKLMYLMQVAIRQEVQYTCTDALFREDTMVSVLACSFLKTTGGAYLQKVLGPPISKMVQSKKSYEIDLHKPGGDQNKNNEKRVRKLVSDLLKSIFESSSACPPSVKAFLFYMRSEISDKYTPEDAESKVRSFFFLRFVCPTIVNPRELGAVTKHPTEEARRGLCISARIVQTLANDGECDTTNKPHLIKLNKLISDNRANIRKYMDSVSNQLVETIEAEQETTQSTLSRKLAVEELQKYMFHKIKSLPPNATLEEQLKNEPVIKLRRALQVCSRGNYLTRSTSSPSSSPSHFVNRLYTESPSKRHSYIDIFQSSND